MKVMLGQQARGQLAKLDHRSLVSSRQLLDLVIIVVIIILLSRTG